MRPAHRGAALARVRVAAAIGGRRAAAVGIALSVLAAGALAADAGKVAPATPLATTATKAPPPVQARARKEGGGYAVVASFTVAAPPGLVWNVLVDFDHMAEILSSVDASKIVNRRGNEFDVDQRSHATAGPLRISMDNVRHVTLTPETEIRSRLVSSDNLKLSDFITRVTPVDQRVRVDVEGTFVPTLLAGAVLNTDNVAAQVGRQYTELRDEILRRQNGTPRPACLATKDCP
ncbi:MAG: SRPBCC family protein [Burkholderiales bacterium]|nr:SRPBCC family protein [Burkholderiales bacterium]